VDENLRMYAATSGDDKLSTDAALEIMAAWSKGRYGIDLELVCHNYFRKRWPHVREGESLRAGLLILNADTEQILNVRISEHPVISTLTEGTVAAGDPENPAVFWLQRFRREIPLMDTPTLKRLLSIAVYQAGELNPLVSGLEMLVYDKKSKKVSFEPPERILFLLRHAKEADEAMARMIF